MSGHTPGPWHWRRTTTPSKYPNSGIEPETWLVAEKDQVLGYYGCGSHEVDVSDADAALIAAAPELLTACEAARGQLDARNPARVLVDAAIARARRGGA